jgi:hypothetical protein
LADSYVTFYYGKSEKVMGNGFLRLNRDYLKEKDRWKQ